MPRCTRSNFRRAWALALLGAALGAHGCTSRAQEPERKPGDKPVITMTRQVALDPETPVEVTPRPIANMPGAAPLPRAKVFTAYSRPWGNDQLNSRVQAPMSEGKWKVLWQTDLQPRMAPSFVLQDANRILVQAGVWQVLNNRDGKLVAKGGNGPGEAVMDYPSAMFYFVDPNGVLAGAGLADGKRAWGISPSFGQTFARPYYARVGTRMVILGVEQRLDAHGRHVPDRSVLEVRDLSAPPRVSATGLLASAIDAGKIHLKTTQVVAAAGEKSVVFAVPGRVCVADLDLRVTAAYEGDFEPRAMSLDEAGRIYLLVKTGGSGALWVVSAEGQRILASTIPDLPEFPPPPAVGYDHRVYIVTQERILGLQADGSRAWELPRESKTSGLTVTTDDHVLFSAGSRVVAVDPQGKASVVMELAGEKLCTPPVLRSDGAILVASESKLFCLISE